MFSSPISLFSALVTTTSSAGLWCMTAWCGSRLPVMTVPSACPTFSRTKLGNSATVLVVSPGWALMASSSISILRCRATAGHTQCDLLACCRNPFVQPSSFFLPFSPNPHNLTCLQRRLSRCTSPGTLLGFCRTFPSISLRLVSRRTFGRLFSAGVSERPSPRCLHTLTVARFALARCASILWVIMSSLARDSKIGPVRVNHKMSTTGYGTRKQGEVEFSNFPISLRDGLVIDVSFVCEFKGSSRAPGGWIDSVRHSNDVLQARANVKNNKYKDVYGLDTRRLHLPL